MQVLKQSLYLIFVLCGFLACRRENPRPYNYHDQLQRYSPFPGNYPDTNRFLIPNTDPVVNGYTKFYYRDSYQLISEGNYQNGRPSGYWKIYYPNGFYMREGNYSSGLLTGYWKFYYPDGKIKEEGNYENNLKTGTWKFFYPSGNMEANGDYAVDARKGEWKFFDNSPGAPAKIVMY